jgi:protein-disulfide isomerase
VIVEMFDYTCHYCRDQHAQLEEARQHFGDRLAILAFPTPLNGRCNSFVPPLADGPHQFACNYARLAVSVWLADRTKFAEFHDWLFKGDEPPPLEAARTKVRALVGQKGLDLAENSAESIQQIEQYTNLFGALNGGKMPKLIDEHMLIDGRFRDGKQMIEVLEEQWKWRK